MKAYWVFAMATAAGLSAHAQECAVMVYVANDSPQSSAVLASAKPRAAAMFREIGVTVRWRTGAAPAAIASDSCGAPLVILIESGAPARASADALAYAAPFVESGTCIHVLLDRVLETSAPSLAPAVLAHVLAHEITHVLERIDRHSKEGIMKAHWDVKDFVRMAFRGLPFTPEDVELIHAGLAKRMLRTEAE